MSKKPTKPANSLGKSFAQNKAVQDATLKGATGVPKGTYSNPQANAAYNAAKKKSTQPKTGNPTSSKQTVTYGGWGVEPSGLIRGSSTKSPQNREQSQARLRAPAPEDTTPEEAPHEHKMSKGQKTAAVVALALVGIGTYVVSQMDSPQTSSAFDAFPKAVGGYTHYANVDRPTVRHADNGRLVREGAKPVINECITALPSRPQTPSGQVTFRRNDWNGKNIVITADGSAFTTIPAGETCTKNGAEDLPRFNR